MAAHHAKLPDARDVSGNIKEACDGDAALWTLLAEIAVAVNERTMEGAIELALQRVCNYMQCTAAQAWELAPDLSGELRPARIWYSTKPKHHAPFREASERIRFPKGIGLPGRVLESGKPAWVFDVTTDTNFPRGPIAIALGMHAALGFPIRVEREVVGVLEFFADTPREAPDKGLLSVMDIVGTQLGRAVERVRASEMQNHLIGMVSHDLRTPLGTMALLARQLYASPTANPAAIGQQVTKICARMTETIGDLCDYSASRSHNFQLTKHTCDLGDVCRSVISECGEARPDKKIIFEEAGKLTGEWDELRVRRMFENLVTNALKFSPANSEVRVSAREGEKDIFIRVQNEGGPIPEDLLPYIFEPFRRYAPSPGSGLGLYIVRAIANAHGGSVTVQANSSTETAFEVRLPK